MSQERKQGRVQRATFEHRGRLFRVLVQDRELSLQERSGRDLAWVSYCTGRVGKDGALRWTGCGEAEVGQLAEAEARQLLGLPAPAGESPAPGAAAPPAPAAPGPAGAGGLEGASRQRCSRCGGAGHNARSCKGAAVGKKPARAAATTTIRGMGPPAAPVVTGPALYSGTITVQETGQPDREVEIRVGDTPEVLAERIGGALSAPPGAATMVQDAPDEAPAPAAEVAHPAAEEQRQEEPSSGPGPGPGAAGSSTSTEVEKEATPVAENPTTPAEVVSLDPFRAAGAAVIDRLLQPVPSRRRPPELTAEEEAAARAEINRTVDAAAAAIGNLIDRIPEASAEDLAVARTEEAPAAPPAGPPMFRFMLPAVAPAAEPPTPGALALRVRELERHLAETTAAAAALRKERDEALARLSTADRALVASGAEIDHLRAAAPALPPLPAPQHVEVYVGPPREGRVHELELRVQRLEQGIRAAFRVLRSTFGTEHERSTLADRLLTDAITDTDRSTTP